MCGFSYIYLASERWSGQRQGFCVGRSCVFSLLSLVEEVDGGQDGEHGHGQGHISFSRGGSMPRGPHGEALGCPGDRPEASSFFVFSVG